MPERGRAWSLAARQFADALRAAREGPGAEPGLWDDLLRLAPRSVACRIRCEGWERRVEARTRLARLARIRRETPAGSWRPTYSDLRASTGRKARLAVVAAELAAEGCGINAIAGFLGVSVETAAQALARTGISDALQYEIAAPGLTRAEVTRGVGLPSRRPWFVVDPEPGAEREARIAAERAA